MSLLTSCQMAQNPAQLFAREILNVLLVVQVLYPEVAGLVALACAPKVTRCYDDSLCPKFPDAACSGTPRRRTCMVSECRQDIAHTCPALQDKHPVFEK